MVVAGAMVGDRPQVSAAPERRTLKAVTVLVEAGAGAMLDHLAEAGRRRRTGATAVRSHRPHRGLRADGVRRRHHPGRRQCGSGRQAELAGVVAPLPEFSMELNGLLAKARTLARSRFGGRLTYGAGLWEEVEWTGFDIVGLNHYRTSYNDADYATNLRRFHRHGKPIVIVEFAAAPPRALPRWARRAAASSTGLRTRLSWRARTGGTSRSRPTACLSRSTCSRPRASRRLCV
jgi:hypothetical protein